ncbi:fibulin-1-like isoform X1 [Chironomus tepperi]|uniref:fibulin-1-like isoform X1 n=1 Tax=Chironomus tepperi TaxID=113505 RepID=UPI00391EF891
MSKVEKLLIVVGLVICAFGLSCGQIDANTNDAYNDYNDYDREDPTKAQPVQEEEAVTKLYYTVGQTPSIEEQISCHFQNKSYREGEEFRLGPNNCSICMCIDTEIKCDDDECMADVPEVPEVVEPEPENGNFSDIIPKEKLKLPEINTTIASLIPEAHPETPNSEAHSKYDTTDLLINCCNIGTYMPNCSDTGIDSVMVNPPAGLCRSTIKHCCMLNNKEYFDSSYFKCDPQEEELLTCCAVCKIGNKISDVPANFKSLMTHCCEAPQPLIQHKREKHSCSLGYTWNDATSACEDVDECKIKNNGCCESQDCENTDGGYRCIPRQVCKVGYELDEDLMECRDYRYTVVNETEEVEPIPILSVTEAEREDPYVNEPIKVNLDLECELGYRYDSATESCLDIDECLESPCQHNCKNLDGNFQCFCRRGYKPNGTLCEDIDECQKNPCSHDCVNVMGSFRCRCPAGMVLGFDRKKCIEKVLNATCPVQYKTHKTVDDKAFLKCVRTPCEGDISKCKAMPKYLTYKNLILPRNFKVSPQGYQIFNIKTKSIKVKVEHKTKVNVEYKGTRVRPASVKDFSIKQEPNRILVSLMRPLSGPQIFTLNINLIKDETKIMESIEIKITVE